jgi:cysteine desulfurase
MLPYLREVYGNASSIHLFGREARGAVEEARERVAHLLRADESEVYFTSGGTESDNMAIKGIAYARRGQGNHIITSKIEHHAVLHACMFLEKNGFEVTYLPVDSYGMVNPEKAEETITDRTILISIMHANNEVGTIQPIEEIGRIAKAHDIPFHTDAVQSMGKIPIDVHAMHIDLLSLSGHKIYGPKGVGALYIRKRTRLAPLMHGGHHERNQRPGTENVPGIVGLGKAVQLAEQDLEAHVRQVREVRDALERRIMGEIEHVFRNGHPTERLPVTSNLSFASVEGESLILSLDMKGVGVASGSACTSGSLEPSHVLTAMGVPPELAQSSLRFSLGRDNTLDDVDYVMEVLPGIVERLRAMSPLKFGVASAR